MHILNFLAQKSESPSRAQWNTSLPGLQQLQSLRLKLSLWLEQCVFYISSCQILDHHVVLSRKKILWTAFSSSIVCWARRSKCSRRSRSSEYNSLWVEENDSLHCSVDFSLTSTAFLSPDCKLSLRNRITNGKCAKQRIQKMWKHRIVWCSRKWFLKSRRNCGPDRWWASCHCPLKWSCRAAWAHNLWSVWDLAKCALDPRFQVRDSSTKTVQTGMWSRKWSCGNDKEGRWNMKTEKDRQVVFHRSPWPEDSFHLMGCVAIFGHCVSMYLHPFDFPDELELGSVCKGVLPRFTVLGNEFSFVVPDLSLRIVGVFWVFFFLMRRVSSLLFHNPAKVCIL